MFKFNWIYTKRKELFAKIQVQHKITRKLMLACLCYEFSIYGTDHELKKRADIENLVRKRLATGASVHSTTGPSTWTIRR